MKHALSVENLWIRYKNKAAVRGVSFELKPGEIFGIVGESGCGKSSLSRGILQITHKNELSGRVLLEDKDLTTLRGEALRRERKNIQMIFQDPYASLNPRMKISKILAEPLGIHFSYTSQEKRKKIDEALEGVGLSADMATRYPHEFSGGQRQRIAIARALIIEPKVLIADEAVSSLDVTVQAQVLKLLKEKQKEKNLAMIFISHNLAVVKEIADRIAVMYLGQIVETGTSESLFNNPHHPYTQALIAAVPAPDPRAQKTNTTHLIKGEPASPLNIPKGCSFHPRCPKAFETCLSQVPQLETKPSHTKSACFLS